MRWSWLESSTCPRRLSKLLGVLRLLLFFSCAALNACGITDVLFGKNTIPPSADGARGGDGGGDSPGDSLPGDSTTVACEACPNACVDEVCCNETCGEQCFACSAVLTGGADGFCAQIRAGEEDLASAQPCFETNGCGNPPCVCNSGRCGGRSGNPCSDDSECASLFCRDGVCCDSACDQPCQGCTMALSQQSSGNCGPYGGVRLDESAPGLCSALEGCTTPPCTCSGGECLSDLGSACSMDVDCASGRCVDEVCCEVAACTGCESCAPTGSCVPSDAECGECGVCEPGTLTCTNGVCPNYSGDCGGCFEQGPDDFRCGNGPCPLGQGCGCTCILSTCTCTCG